MAACFAYILLQCGNEITKACGTNTAGRIASEGWVYTLTIPNENTGCSAAVSQCNLKVNDGRTRCDFNRKRCCNVAPGHGLLVVPVTNQTSGCPCQYSAVMNVCVCVYVFKTVARNCIAFPVRTGMTKCCIIAAIGQGHGQIQFPWKRGCRSTQFAVD